MGGLEEHLTKHQRVGLDTSIFIYHFEAHPVFLSLTTVILELVRRGRILGFTSEITVMEILVKPLEQEQQDIADEYETLLDNFPYLKIAIVDRQVSRKASELRARYRLKPADALQIATALKERASAFVTNDSDMKSVKDLEVIILQDFVPA